MTAATKLAGVIGDPVRHSLSPVIHNAGFAALGLDWVYVALPTASGHGQEAISAMRTLDIRGLSVTMPHKESVVAAVDELTPQARQLGAVNCVRWEGDRLVGDNTDGAGFIAGLQDDFQMDVEGLTVVVVGAGGAARAVVHALGAAGATSVQVVNRTASRATAAAEMAGAAGSVVEPAAISGADLVVNATSVGMGGAEVPFDVDLLGASQTVVDLIYHPDRTALLDAAAARGARTANGVSMLLHQAIVAFESWTHQRAPVQAMRTALDIALKDQKS